MRPTHEVLDLTYTEEEGQGVMHGTYEECQKFVAQQSDYFMYRIIPIIDKKSHIPDDDTNNTDNIELLDNILTQMTNSLSELKEETEKLEKELNAARKELVRLSDKLYRNLLNL